MDNDDDNANRESRPAKRRKIRLACQECRDKKTRCDGNRPICDACVRKRLGPEHCIYLEAPSDVDPNYVKSLEDRIRDLERAQHSRSQLDYSQSCAARPPATVVHDASTPLPRQSQLFPESRPLAPLPALTRGNDDCHTVAAHLTDLQSHHYGDNITDTGHSGNGVSGGPAAAPFSTPAMVSSDGFSEPLCGASRYTDEPGVSAEGQANEPTVSSAQEGPLPSHCNRQQRDGHEDLFDEHTDKENEDALPGDAMGASEGTPKDARRKIFLGPSSTAAFMRMVQASSGIVDQLPQNVEDGASSTTSRTSRLRILKSKNDFVTLLDELTLPPRRLADECLEAFWDHSHLYYPVLHKPSFMKTYDMIWTRAETYKEETHQFGGDVHLLRAFHATLNIALALGCVFPRTKSPSSSRRAKNFFERSQALLKDADVDCGSVQLVQSLILTAQYLQSTDMVNRCWVTVGTAVRVGQGIGIHLDRRSESQAEREERKRTWWCCLLMDRVLSMTFGRPPMVVWPTAVPIPDPIDDERLSQIPGSSNEPIETQEMSKNAFFTNTLRLTDILMTVLKNMYRPAEERKLQGTSHLESDITLAVVLDGDLVRWRQQLPEYLIYRSGDSASVEDTIFTRQAAVLHCRYLHLRTLLFRPITLQLSEGFFSAAKAAERSTDFQRMIFGSCIKSCVWAAQELVDLIHHLHHTDHAPAQWYAIFYLYNSGTVLLSVLVSPELQTASEETAEALANTWSRCIETLAAYERGGSSFARNCRRILQAALTSVVRSRQPLASDSLNQAHDPGNDTENGILHVYQQQQQQQSYELDEFQMAVDEGNFVDMLWPAGSQSWLNSLAETCGIAGMPPNFPTMP